MKCPICENIDLVMSDRQGVEIDYCPKCRGVWLDRGELDKIIERSIPAAQQFGKDNHSMRGHDDDHEKHHERQMKRKTWLSEIFD